ncbi:MAG: sulfotransferase domain-containing protein [Bacteroidetes bacterium]|nr:sulfotransferase domain-containing protein [Bacteroidota bacterium]
MKKINKTPNFFIIGAPKCGTTSMAKWLSEHPNIFMSKIKEPHYYNKDHKHIIVGNKKDYFSLFKDTNEEHKIVGEASVWYLYSKVAVKNIVNDVLIKKNVKFLVMVRNPIKMAYSLHEQQVFNLNEPEKDFRKAWFLQEKRKQNKNIGFTTRDSQLLLYGNICKLGVQVQRLFDIVPREQVKIIVLDDVKETPLIVYKDVLSFLDLPDYRLTNFSAMNTAKVRKSNFIALFVKILGKIKNMLKIKKGFGILNKTNELNLRNRERQKLDVDTEDILKKYFKEDINLLSKLIKRDLSHWIE